MYLWCQCHVLTTYQIYCRVADLLQTIFATAFFFPFICGMWQYSLSPCKILFIKTYSYVIVNERAMSWLLSRSVFMSVYRHTWRSNLETAESPTNFYTACYFYLWCKYNFRWKCEWLQRSMYWLANFNFAWIA